MSCATADAEIHEDAVAPYALRYTVTSSDPTNFDLSTATAGEFRVKRGDGTTPDTWAATLEDQSTTSITLVHVFSSDDVDDPGLLIVQPYLATPSGNFLAEPRTLKVRGEFT